MSVALRKVETIHQGYMTLLLATLETDEGTTFQREIEHHGHAVAVLPYDAARRTALLRRGKPFAELSAKAADRLAAYNRADRDEAEELYGDFVDVVETGTELLADIRDAYATTLAEGVDELYEAEFNRAVKRRWSHFGLEIDLR